VGDPDEGMALAGQLHPSEALPADKKRISQLLLHGADPAPQSRLGHIKGLGGSRKAARFCYL